MANDWEIKQMVQWSLWESLKSWLSKWETGKKQQITVGKSMVWTDKSTDTKGSRQQVATVTWEDEWHKREWCRS